MYSIPVEIVEALSHEKTESVYDLHIFRFVCSVCMYFPTEL